MGRGNVIGTPALILFLFALAPPSAEAGFRFEDGVYLGSAEQLADWADAMDRARSQQFELDACLADAERCDRRLRSLSTVVERARDLTPDRQVRLINRYVNKRRYRRDPTREVESRLTTEPVQLRSRWQTLVEFMRRGGDCEDFATSKYLLLRELGFRPEDLRVVVVWDRATRAHHAVLAVQMADDEVWVLDSDDSIYRRSNPFGYRYVYALNETSVWDHELDDEAWARITPTPPEDSS
jgi:predicted transglutaminase-like cysteine proteinase